jgi:uncharacterized protein (TIGR03032 family)
VTPTGFQFRADDGFVSWLDAAGGTLLVTAYDANALLVIGYDGVQVKVLARHFERPLGIDVDGDRLALATRNAITLFTHDAVLARSYDPAAPGRYDGLFVPRASYHIPELNAHEIAFGGTDLWFVNTRFSCLATPSATQSFEARWRPGFISALVPEDRCHLNGLAMRHGKPALVTIFAATDTATGWRTGSHTGGAVIDADSGEPVVGGLCMPHSPRLHAGTAWVLNSGAGELLAIDRGGRVETVCRLDGYARGLAFAGGCALMGLSKVRERHIFGEFPLARRAAELTCGIAVVELNSGRQVGMLSMAGAVTEVFDVRFVPDLRRINVLRADSDEARAAVTSGDARYWLRPEDERHDDGR